MSGNCVLVTCPWHNALIWEAAVKHLLCAGPEPRGLLESDPAAHSRVLFSDGWSLSSLSGHSDHMNLFSACVSVCTWEREMQVPACRSLGNPILQS